MRVIVATAAILIAAATGGAKADPYRWCALDMGESGTSNCYYMTLEQCKAAAAGSAGSFCAPNNYYTGPATPPPPPRRKPHQ